MSSQRRGPWSQQEDAYLMRLVQVQGALNWVRIAQTLGSRTPKQCRERYHQNLKPTLNHEPITPEEGQQIEALVNGIGKRWAEIARRLNGRSDNAVKNWWNGSQNRRKRLDRRRISGSLGYESRRHGATSRPSLSLNPNMSAALPGMTSPTSMSQFSLGNYSIKSPLLSPSSTGSPGSDGLDGTSYFASDHSCGYVTSPRSMASQSPAAKVDLPPILTQSPSSPRTFHLPAPSQLPGLESLLSICEKQQGRSAHLAPITASYLPTAPNSPTHAPQGRMDPRQSSPACPKDSRMDVAALLG